MRTRVSPEGTALTKPCRFVGAATATIVSRWMDGIDGEEEGEKSEE